MADTLISSTIASELNKMCPSAEKAALGTAVLAAVNALGISASDTAISIVDGTDSITIGSATAGTIAVSSNSTITVGNAEANSVTVGHTSAGALALYSGGAITIGDATATDSITLISAGALDLAKTGQMTTVKGTLNVDEAVTFDSTLSSAATETSATPATTRLVRSELTLTPATSLAVSGSGSLAAVRGCVTLTTGKECTDGFLYGVQGKFVGDGATLSVGSGHVAGVLAQMSGSSMTVTNGHVGVIVASGQSLPSSADISMIYCESGGGTVNAVIESNVKSTYFLSMANFETGGNCSSTGTPGSVTGATGWIKCYVDGAVRYIALTDSVS